MGLDPMRARGSLRFSLGIYNDEKDVDHVLMHLPKIIAHLRANSALASSPAQDGKLAEDTSGVSNAPEIIEPRSGDVVSSTVSA
jgi:hypothetical protein